MTPHEQNHRRLLRFLLGLAACLLVLALLVLVPLLTHRSPTPDQRYTERRPVATETPEPTEEPARIEYPDPNTPEQDEALQAILEEFVAQNPGAWDIYVYDLSRGKYAGISPAEEEPMASASLIKLFIMGAVFQQIREGSLNYWESYSYLCKMIIINDNYYTNYLIYQLGGGIQEAAFDYVNIFARSLGCQSTALNSTLPAGGAAAENTTSAEDCALFFKALYRHELVSPEYSADMLTILQAQAAGGHIQAGLPKGTECAHKTGDLEQLCCADAGLVFSPGADYILAVINNAPEDDAAAKAAIAELSARVYACLNPDTGETPEPLLEEP